MNDYQNKSLLFGLDIGTRTVIGNVGYIEEDKWIMIESVCMAHADRAMMDGQIHDIHKVAAIVEEVKRRLEEKVGVVLKDVAIAAAGRVLDTQIAHVEKQFEETLEITKEAIESLELSGIDEAKKMLEGQHKRMSSEYFCVAHTVIHYYLDDYMIGNLDGHKGEKIGADILATFLPKGVIDSLYAVTKRAGLTVKHLTLEPIAAMNAVIPENLRLLNLALIDIGAGTSDIALTKDGSIIAYGMIPEAGDETTEAIVHKYLVDFNTAERMKQEVGNKDFIEYEDIIGIPNTITKEELLESIHKPIKHLADSIAQKIWMLNGQKSPNAVFCVGGGSQMPGLIERLAQALDMPTQRVAMRSAQHVQNVIYECEISSGPEMITPIGICMTAGQSQNEQFIKVKVNDKEVSILHTKELTVLDALLEAGITHTDIFPTHGKSLMFKLNGQRVRVKGTIGKPSALLLNNQPTSLDTLIKNKDEILLRVAEDGEDAVVKMLDYIKEDQLKSIYVEGELLKLPILLANGDHVELTYSIKAQDSIEVIDVQTVKDLIILLKRDIKDEAIQVNGIRAEANNSLKNGDCITFAAEELALEKEGHDIEIAKQQGIQIEVNGDWITLPYKETSYMVANIFDYIEFDLSRPKGTVQILRNDRRAAVTESVEAGDKVQIYWEN